MQRYFFVPLFYSLLLMLLLLKNNMEVSACKPPNQIPATDESHARADSRFPKKTTLLIGQAASRSRSRNTAALLNPYAAAG